MLKYRSFLWVVFFLAAFWGLSAAPLGKAQVGKEVKYWLKGELYMENGQSALQDIKLYFPNLESISPYQRVEKLTFFFKGEKQKSRDSKWLIFSFPQIPPGGKAGIKFEAVVGLYDISFPLRADWVKTADLPRYLEDDHNIQPSHPQIAELTRQLTQNIKNPYYKALALYDYVRENLAFDMKKEPYSASEVLRKKVAQCADATYLYISLCRAAGIPARIVSGVHFKPGEDKAEITHGWAEIYLEPYGWIPVDPTLGRYPYYRLLGFGESRDGYLILNRDSQICFQFLGDRISKENAKLHWKMQIERQDISEAAPPRDFILSEKQKTGVSGYDFNPAVNQVLAKERSGQLEEYLAQLKTRLQNSGATPGDYFAASLAAYKLKRYETAMDLVERLQSRGMVHPEVYYLKGRIAFDSKQFPLAEDALVRAVNLNPRNLRYAQALTDLLTLESSWEELRYFCAWADSYIPNPFFIGQQGYALAQMGKFRQAIPLFAKASQSEPQNGWYKAAQGWCYLESGDKIRGKQLIKEGLSQGGSFEDKLFFERLLKIR